MANFEFNIKAQYDEVAQARQELEHLRQELDKVNKGTSTQSRADLTERFREQQTKIKDLTAAIQRYGVVMGKDFTKQMAQVTQEVYSFELQADAAKREMDKLSVSVAKMQTQLRKGGLDVGTKTVLTDNLKTAAAQQAEAKARYENLTGLAKDARTQMEGMQSEYAKFSGSTIGAKSSVDLMTDALGQMMGKLQQVPTVGEGASSIMQRLGGDAKMLATGLIGGLGFEQLASRIFNTRSEFQQLEISFNTMLGSEQKAGALMNQLIDTAAKTPFDMGSITNGAKQLLAYGTAANEVNGILTKLGDISAGLSVPLGDLVYLYGTTMAQGRMYTMDLRQFMGRGIPMAESLGKIMGKSTQEVQDAVSKGKVGADLVKKAIENMTAEGGKFGGLMEKQSQTLQGRWSNIEDSVEQMFNEMGKKTEGIYGKGLEGIGDLVDNWETVVKVIGAAAVAVGTYKAGLMAASSIQKAKNTATLNSITSNIDAQIEAARERGDNYRTYNQRDTDEYKNYRKNDLSAAISNTTMIGNEKAEEIVSLKIKEAEADGIITKEMAEQLQLKRDMLVAETSLAEKQSQEVRDLTSGIDAKMSELVEKQNKFRGLNGKETPEYRNNRYEELFDTVTNTDLAGDENVERYVSLKIKEAEAEGLISEETAKQLQLKRDLLVEQTKIAAKEEAEYEANIAAVAAAKEEARTKVEDMKTAAGINVSELAKKRAGQTDALDNNADDIAYKQEYLNLLDAEIGKQKEILQQKIQQQEADLQEVTNMTGLSGADQEAADSIWLEQQAEVVKQEEVIRNLIEERKAAQESLMQSEAEEKDLMGEITKTKEEYAEAAERQRELDQNSEALIEEETNARLGNTSATSANSTAKATNAAATSSGTAANAANTTSEAVNTTAERTNTTAVNLNSEAKTSNSLVSKLAAVGTGVLTTAQTICTNAVRQATMSLKALWATMLANPITAVITLVTTAISVLSMFGSEEEDLADKTKELGNKAQEASSQVQSLFSVLKTGNAKDHKDTINELKSAYEEYGVQLDETKMKSSDLAVQADELKAHEEELIGVIQERSLEMERANQLQEAYESYNTSNDTAYSDFKEATKGTLSTQETGAIRSMISQEDIEALAELQEKMKSGSATMAEYKAKQAEINVQIIEYLNLQGKSSSQIIDLMSEINTFTSSLAVNKGALEEQVNMVNQSIDNAKDASDATKNLTWAQRMNAAANSASKMTFKELNSEIQSTLSLCQKKYFITLKLNYDDSELPAWIKKMSDSTLKKSLGVRNEWLKDHKKGDVFSYGGYKKTYEQVLNEVAMMQAAGSNRDNKQEKSQKEIDKEKKAAEKAAKAAEKAKRAEERAAEKKKKAQEQADSQLLSLQQKNEEQKTKMEADGTEKRFKLLKNDYEKRKAEIDKQEKEFKKKNKEAGKSETLTKEQSAAINEARKLAADELTKKTAEVYREQTQELYDYLKDYGDVESKKLAITQEYAEKIRKARESSNEIEVMRLQAEQKATLNKADTDNLVNQMDMASVFQDFGMIFKEPLRQTIESLEKLSQTADFKTRTFEEQQKVYEAISKAETMLDESNGFDIKDIAYSVAEYNNSLSAQAIAQRELAEATREYADACKKLIDATQNGTDADKEAAQAAKEAAYAKMSSAQTDYDDATNKVVQSQSKASKEMTKFSKTIDKIKNGVSALRSGSLSGIWNALGGSLQSKIAMFVSGASSVNKQIAALTETLSNSGMSLANFEQDLSSVIMNGLNGLDENSFSVDKAISAAKGGISSLFAQLFSDPNAFQGVQTGIGDALANIINGSDSKNDAISKTSGAIGSLVSSVAQAGQSSGNLWGAIIGLILQLLDDLADSGLSNFLGELLEKIGDAVEGLLEHLFDRLIPTIIEGVAHIVESVINGIGNMVGFDDISFSSLFNNSNEEEVKEREEELVKAAEHLQTSIEGLTEELEKQSGTKAIETAEELKKYQQDLINNARNQLINQNNYHSAHHSNDYYWNKGSFESDDGGSWAIVTQALEEYKKKNPLAETVKDSASSYEDLLMLTPEQLDYIRTHYNDQWQSILSVGKYDASDEKWEALADLAGTLDDTMEKLQESLTQISFDSLKENFISTLMDLDSSAQDFSKNFSEYLAQAVLTAQVSNLMEDQMKDFYKDWASMQEANGGTLTSANIAELKKRWDDLVQQGLSIRDEVADITGYSSTYSQDASSGTFETMSQDTGEELSGRFTAVQIATEGTFQVVQEINDKMDGLAADSLLTTNVSQIMQNVMSLYAVEDESRTILAQSLMYLQSIDDRQDAWNKPMLQAFKDVKEMKDKINLL